MQYSTLSTCVAGLLTIALASCDATYMKSRELADTEVIGNTADLRMVFRDRANYNWTEDRIIPTRILCAEPSPDVAKVMQAAFGGSIAAEVFGKGGGAAALSATSAEALAQLGERLATIQLLRDGLYRACEAYANGALTETAYVVMLSRFDDTMVTMLLGELAAGAFGRSLAALGGTAEARSFASTLPKMAKETEDAASLAKSKADEKEKEAAEAQERADAAKKKADESGKSEDREDAIQAQKEADAKKAEAAEAEEFAKLMANAASTAKVTAVAAASGAISNQSNNDAAKLKVAEHIATMQRKYIENINADALVVACIHALSKSDTARSAMRGACWDGDATDGNNSILGQILETQSKVLQSVILRNIDQRTAESFDGAVTQMETIIKATKRLRSTAGVQPQQGTGGQSQQRSEVQPEEEAEVQPEGEAEVQPEGDAEEQPQERAENQPQKQGD